jgi:hypothetical protein
MSGVLSGMVDLVVPLVVAAALMISVLVLLSARSPSTALAVFLDLLLAAGLLHLSANLSGTAIASTALVVVIRKIAGLGLAAGHRRPAVEAHRP